MAKIWASRGRRPAEADAIEVHVDVPVTDRFGRVRNVLKKGMMFTKAYAEKHGMKLTEKDDIRNKYGKNQPT